MKTITKILLGTGACILTSLSGVAIASTNDHIVNKLVTPNVSRSNLRPAQPILIVSHDEQGKDRENRENHEDDNDQEDHEDGDDHEDHEENS